MATPAPAASPQQQAAEALLAFQQRVRGEGAAAVAAEIVRRENRLAGAPAPAEPQAALELAWLLSRQARNGDVARGLALAETLARPDAPPAWQPLARWLREQLAAQRALEEQAERLGQQLREQQRRLEQLQAQIEALRAIERSLGSRPAANP